LSSDEKDEYVEMFLRPDGMSGVYCDSTRNFYEKIHYEDQNAEKRNANPFWPFSCFMEWQIAQFLENLGISQEKQDEFFNLKYVCQSNL
jgi:hypothetical protein